MPDSPTPAAAISLRRALNNWSNGCGVDLAIDRVFAMRLLLLHENDVRQLLTMEEALEAVEQGFRGLALDEAENLPRGGVRTDECVLHVRGAAISPAGVLGAKIYSSHRRSAPQF